MSPATRAARAALAGSDFPLDHLDTRTSTIQPGMVTASIVPVAAASADNP
jgi:hypothetical protein